MILIALLFTIAGGLIGIPLFLFWVLKQSVEAARYRRLLAQQVSAPTGDRWMISYRMNGKVHNMTVEGKTEELALLEYIKMGGAPRGVVDCKMV